MTKNLNIKRYPATENKSLQAWNASDEYILSYVNDHQLSDKRTVIFNDRFGFLGCHLSSSNAIQIINYKSEQKALQFNLKNNELVLNEGSILFPLSELPSGIQLGIIKVPKSIELFEFYLSKLSKSINKDGVVLCGFMTKYFNKSMVSAAETYFEEVEQSLAWKKSRILILKKPKDIEGKNPIQSFSFSHSLTGDIEINQYPGVFSSKRIDQATEFFLDHLGVTDNVDRILDLASGNGILGITAKTINPKSEITLVDDSFLAVESSRLNLNSENTHFKWKDTLEDFESEYFDLVISNPPFHFEFETNIEVSIFLFKEVYRCLKIGGRFRSVASKHLNFKTHLDSLFSSTKIVAETTKFVVYESVK